MCARELIARPPKILRLVLFSGAVMTGLFTPGPPHAAAAPVPRATVVETEGTVEVLRAKSAVWNRALTNQLMFGGDRLRTAQRSRAVVLMADRTPWRVGELGLLEIPTDEREGIGFIRGLLYYFHRDKPGTLPVRTPTTFSLIRGTEFNLEVKEDGTTILTMFDGEVDLQTPQGNLNLRSGQQAVAAPGQAPRKTAVLFGENVIQWALYYPGIVRLEDLELGAPEPLRESLAAYQRGELLVALEQYAAQREPASAGERLYLAALLLSVGNVERCEAELTALGNAGGRHARVAGALRELMSAVRRQEWNGTVEPELATEWMARSYYRQSLADLEGARAAARKAVAIAPEFGFGWERVAELEFSFGRVDAAQSALDKALAFSPRNAQALALKGFVLAAQNRIGEAIGFFDQAIAVDGALGNAWLGRGLCKIRLGRSAAVPSRSAHKSSDDADSSGRYSTNASAAAGDARTTRSLSPKESANSKLETGGLEDLLVAAALEPQRSLLRSYLGKAYADEGDTARASKELELARRLDAKDPTAWLYSALLNQQRSLINEAVRDLERSKELNENRSVFRSRLLLDQDQAVRGANLANIFRDAGMPEVSYREAVKAVNTDYANYSAHLFLADTYNGLRDPRQVNLRFETPFLSEYLVANLLAPVGAGTLSPLVTQQEYSKLFERDRVGLASVTEYFSNGDWTQAAAQYGTYRNSAYSAEVAYRSENGQRVNNDLEQLTLNLRLKQEITPRDRLYFQAVYYNAEGGDLAQLYDPERPNTTLRIKETQEPILLLGYQHEWGPGNHTLLLAGRLQDTVLVNDRQQQTFLIDLSNPPNPQDVIATLFNQEYRSDLELYTVEGQHIFQRGQHAVIVGGRWQGGEFDTQNRQSNPRYADTNLVFPFTRSQDVSSDFERVSGYGYWQWRVVSPLLLVGGVTYDWIKFPVNHRFGPVTPDEADKDQVSPKAGLIWTPLKDTTLRAGYSRALGGVSIDQSFQLEPSQVAGFNQAFRSLIPESAAGPTTAPRFETWGVSFEQKFGRGTYLGVAGEWLESDVERAIGVFEFLPPLATASTRQQLDYRERSLVLTMNQLVGDEWSFGVRYRLSQAELDERFPDIPANANLVGDFRLQEDLESTLHQVNLYALYNHPSGFFGQCDAQWYAQSNRGYSPDRPGDDFWQFNVYAGYRFARRRVEVRVGVLNLTDRDYRINPLNLTAQLPRHRTFAASLSFNF